MGSAKQPETLQLLKQDAVPDDASQPSSTLPCSQEKDSSLPHIQCDGGDLTMRNCCVNDVGTKDGSQEDTMVDNPEQKEKEPAVSTKPSMELVTATGTVALKDTTAGGPTFEEDLRHNSKQGSSCRDLPSSLSNTCNPLESKAVPGDGHTHLTAEPCLKGANKDPSSAPASLKHVAFLEPTKKTTEAENIQAGTAHSEGGPALPTCLKNTSQGQLGASKGETSHFSSDVCEAADRLSEGRGGPLISEAPKESTQDPLAAEATSEKSSRPATEADQLGHSREVRSPAPETSTGGNSSRVPGSPVAAIPHKAKGISGESQTSPGEATKEAEGLREATPSEYKSQNQAQEQQTPETTNVAVSDECTTGVEKRSVGPFTQTCSLDVPPPQHDAGTQVDNRVSLVSVAISPINPPDGSSAFTFHTRGLGASSSLKSPGLEEMPAKKDAEMQVSIPVETRSVATGPMTPVTKSPQASYPEVHVKGAQEEAPEPVREVSWDEKGMTWEVYGASMEVEVLGMAIQKHLEKQIEEHGRQTVMTPQSTRASSIKGAPPKGEVKRQPSVFRALLQNVRRPRCCSRGGPTVE